MYILRLLLIVCVIAYSTSCSAQIIKSKDLVSLGGRSEFLKSCSKGVDKKLINVNGLEFETYKYCACVCDNLIPTINSWELEKALIEDRLTDLFLQGENLEIIRKCFDGNSKIGNDYEYKYSSNPELQKKIGIQNCVNEIMSDEEMNSSWTKESAIEYCDCAVSKLFSAGYTFKDILEIEDENSLSFNEIIIPCITDALKQNSSNSYNFYDINGGDYRSLIPLIDYFGQGYKIKITIYGVTKYYLFDTGASDLVIDRDMERELLLKGVLKKENYLSKTEYTLANN